MSQKGSVGFEGVMRGASVEREVGVVLWPSIGFLGLRFSRCYVAYILLVSAICLNRNKPTLML